MLKPRVDTVETLEEFAAIAHLRGWCHDTNLCPICRAHAAGIDEAIAKIAEGEV